MRKRKLILLICLPVFLIALIIPLINSTEISYWPSIINKTNGCSLYSSATPNLAWEGNGTIVSMSDRNQHFVEMCTDGAGGVIMTWYENLPITWDDIYAQRFNSDGIPQWTNNGSVMCYANDSQSSPKICTDGEGGAIIAWFDWRIGPNANIFGQRVNYDGVVQWTANGTVICNDSSGQDYMAICSDGNGGAIIAWKDLRGGTNDIYAQKIDINGVPQWTTNGVLICNASGSQIQTAICSDGAGGAIITWRDGRTGDDDIYAQRINSSGNTEWLLNGVPICEVSGPQMEPKIINDDQGGAIIIWTDQRNIISNYDIYAQRVNSMGETLWGLECKPICTNIGDQAVPQICSDGLDGWIITWQDGRSSNFDIYAQRINSEGIVMWTTNGIGVCTANDDQVFPKLCTDGNGAIITWSDGRNAGVTSQDIYAQRIYADGKAKWTSNGIVISEASLAQIYPSIISDGNGGAFIAWDDYRGANTTIYAQYIKNELPNSNNLGTIITTTSGTDTIAWVLTDDFGSGSYHVLANDSNGNFYTWVEGFQWSNNTPLSVPINRTVAGTFEYRIEYFDDQNQPGIPDSVIVKIIDDSSVPPEQPIEPIYLISPQGGEALSNLALPLFIGIIIAFLATIITMLLLSRRISDISGSKTVTKK